MPTAPSEFPRWADVSGTITEPASGKKDVGWIFEEEPPFDYFNWLHNVTYNWLVYLNEALRIGHNEDGTHITNVIGSGPLASDASVDANRAVDTDHIKIDAVTADKINSDVAGDGLVPNGGTGALDVGGGDGITSNANDISVNVDGSTIEIDTDVVRVKDNGITLAKLAGGTANRVFGTDGSGDPELTQIAATQIADGAVNEAKVSGKVARRNGSFSVNAAASGSNADTPGKQEAVTFLTNVAFPTADDDYGWHVRKESTPDGLYQLRPPHNISGGTVTLDFNNSDVIPVLLSLVGNRTLTIIFRSGDKFWEIIINTNTGDLVNSDFYFATLAID